MLHSCVSSGLAALVDTRELLLVHTVSCSTKFPNFGFPVKFTGKSLIGTVIYTRPSPLSLFSRVSAGKVVLLKFFYYYFIFGQNNRFPVEHVLLHCVFYQFSSCSPWENSRHFKTPLVVSPRNDFWATCAEISYWWLTAPQAIWLAEKRDLRIIQCTASERVDRSWEIFGVKLKKTRMKADGGVITQIRVVLPESVETNFPRGTNNQKYYPDMVSDRHLLSSLVSQTLFRGKTSGGDGKCRLFSQTVYYFTL